MRKESLLSAGLVAVFGLPFLGIGAGVLVWAAFCWKTYLESASWERVPAWIESVEFKTHTGSDSTTYSVECRYSYEFRGQAYAGTRVGIMGGSSSNRKAHRRRYDVLKEHMDAKKPYLALVDPEGPERAILFRKPEAWMYVLVPFGLVFAGAGAGLMAGGIRAVRAKKRRGVLEGKPGERPWLFRDDWREFRVRASVWKQLVIPWVFAVFGAVFLSIFHILFAGEEVPFFGKLIVWGLTGMIGIVFLAAVVLTVRQIVHGTPELVLTELPVVPGRRMVAAMRTTRCPIDAARVKLTISCQKKVTRKSAGETSITYEDAYRRELEVDADSLAPGGAGTLVPVVIDIPAGLPGRRGGLLPEVTWKLEVKARMFPISLRASFDLPVFEADESEIRKRQA